MLRFLISMSGARADILERLPAEKARYAALGAVVLTTGVLSAAYLALGLYELVGIALAPVMATGLVLALLFLNLDRWLMMSATVSSRRILLAALPRILLGILLGLIVSTALTLQIFRTDIDMQTSVMRQQADIQFQQNTVNSQLSKQIGLLQKKLSNYQSIISSKGKVKLNPSQDGILASLNSQLAQARKTETTDFQKWQCQLYGGPGCDTVMGNGPIAEADHAMYLNAQQQVANLQQQVQAREELLTGSAVKDEQSRVREAEQNLPGTESLLQRDQAKVQSEQKAFLQANNNAPSLLTRLDALNQLAAHNTTLNIVRLIVVLLIGLTECLPIVARLLMPRGHYERAVEASRRFDSSEASFGYDVFRSQALEEMREREVAGFSTPGRASQPTSSAEDFNDLALRAMRDMRSAGRLDDDPPLRFPAT